MDDPANAAVKALQLQRQRELHRRRLEELRARRLPNMTKAQKKAAQERQQATLQRAKEAAEDEAATRQATAEMAEAGETEDEAKVYDAAESNASTSRDMSAMMRRNDLLVVELGDFVHQCVDWFWKAVVKPAYLQYRADGSNAIPLQLCVQQQFVNHDREALEKCYISVLIVMYQGHVFGFGCDTLGGMKQWLHIRGGKVVCELGRELEVLKEEPSYSAHFGSKKHDTAVIAVDISNTPTLSPSYWMSQRRLPLSTEFMTHNIQNQSQFEECYADDESRRALVQRVMDRHEELKREESHAADELAAIKDDDAST